MKLTDSAQTIWLLAMSILGCMVLCSTAAPSLSDFDEPLSLFNKYLESDSKRYSTRLSEVMTELSLNSPEQLRGLTKQALIKSHPELERTAEFLLMPNRKVVSILAENLFQIVVSSCNKEVANMEHDLRKRIDQIGALSTLENIFQTYEKDCGLDDEQ